MAKYSKKAKPSPETVETALKIARGTQKPGQTKEQTKLIAQGIQKGIDQYKKQQNAKARELDKQNKKLQRDKATTPNSLQVGGELPQFKPAYKLQWLPWILLALTWLGIITFFFIK